jgi:Siphovirus Gp157.
MASLYAITQDMEAVFRLVQNAVDEDGNPRELNEEEMQIVQEWFTCTKEEFHNKVDSYCKFIKNCKIHAENIDNERKTYKAELDRLAARAKVQTNTAERLQNMLKMCMETLGIDKTKTELFSCTIQNTQMNVKPYVGDDLSHVPECYLKPRELDTLAIKADIKAGKLRVGTDGLERGKVIDAMTGEVIQGIYATQGTALVIR